VATKLISCLLVLLMFLLLPPVAQGACAVDRQATVALQVNGGVITVPLEVNGITATFILDTGAQRSVVSEAAVQRLGLARDQWVGTTMRGIGGIDRRPNANPRSLSLGGVPLVRRTVTQDTSLTVGVLPLATAENQSIDGLLGRDFLSLFDLDLDVPAHRITLYRVHDCAGRFLPWSSDYATIPIAVPVEQAIIVPVTLDGMTLRALLDSGASSSLVAAPGIYKLGLDSAILSADPSGQISGLGSRVLTVHRHQFTGLRVGNQTVETPSLWVEPLRLSPIADMLLGADWLAARRVWISFATRQLFVAAP
jgi:Aspartyl protease